MIEGLKLKVTGSEIAGLCRDAAMKFEEMSRATLEKAASIEDEEPDEALEERFYAHEKAADAEELRFIANHVVGHETYELSVDELHHIGVGYTRYMTELNA